MNVAIVVLIVIACLIIRARARAGGLKIENR